MKRWKIHFVITGIYLALNGVGVQAQIDPENYMKIEEKLKSELENGMKTFDHEAEDRRENEGDEFDEDKFDEERLVEDRRIRRMVLEETRSRIESYFSERRESLYDAHALEELEESEKKFYEWIEEKYEALELVSPSANVLKSHGNSVERGIEHKTEDRVGEGYPGANPLVDEDGLPIYTSDDQEQSTPDDLKEELTQEQRQGTGDDTFLPDYDLTGQEVFEGKMRREKEWFNDRLTWPVLGHDESFSSLDQSFQTWEGKEILNTSFMDPSWTGLENHTYPGHTGTDIGYFSRGKNAERWTKDTYEADKSDFAFVIAAKGGNVVLVNNQEGDACGSWLLTQEQNYLFENPATVNLEVSDDCDGGCASGNCAGNYVVIDHDPEDEGLLNRAGFRYTSYFHLQKGSDVQEGQRVERSEIIGRIGSSGQSMSPHLHFEVHKEEMNPEKFVDIKTDYLKSLVDPFYSMHSSNNPTSPVGSSKWQNQCYRDTETMYGLVTGSYFPAPWSVSNLDLDAALEMSGENWRMCGMVPESGQ